MDESPGIGESGPEEEVRLCILGAQASAMPREEFKKEVERHLTGQETEPHEILYFKGTKARCPLSKRHSRLLG